MTAPLTFGSLFAGIGGLDLGLERAGMRCVWQVEKDAYCRRVLAKHWPDVTRYEDVRDVGRDQLAPVDVICGGFPCQDISVAGRAAGLAGERSGLWSEYARIVRELRPGYVVVENVAALLGRGMGTVLGDLAALGYDAEWRVLSAAGVGAPHLRERIFIVAYANTNGDDGRARWAWRSDSGSARQPEPVRPFQDTAAVRSAMRVGQHRDAWRREWTEPADGRWWLAEPDVGRVAHGVPARMDRLRGLGNAVVPQVAEVVGRLIVEHAA